MLKKWIIPGVVMILVSLSGCSLNSVLAPGHDPDGPGNSENAHGHS